MANEQNDLTTWGKSVENSVMPFSFTPLASSEFHGNFNAATFLNTSVFSMSAGDHAAERTTEHIALDDDEYAVISFQLSGLLSLSQRGQSIRIAPGQIGLYLSSYPVQLECYGNYASRSIRIPLSRFSSKADRWREIGAQSLDASQGLAPPVLSFLTELARTEATVPATSKVAIANHVIGLVETMLSDLISSRELATSSTASDLLNQCLEFIDTHLSNSELNPHMVANSAHISTRYLHQIFTLSGLTCARHIRHRRLEKVRLDLADPDLILEPVEKILQRWGVQNPSHFGQVFKNTEGCTPTEFRKKMIKENRG